MRSRLGFVGSTLLLALGLVSATAQAGDHHDGSAVLADPAADLTGLYAFVPATPTAPLVAILGFRPFALSRSEVGNHHDYSIRVRPAALAGQGAALRSRVGRAELRLTCRFNRGLHEVACELLRSDAAGVTTRIDAFGGDMNRGIRGADGRVQVMASLRTDPYMTNVEAVSRCLDEGEGAFLVGERKIRNSFVESFVNSFALVVELDRALLPTEAGLPLLAVAGESVRVDRAGAGTRIDRVGRPHASTFLIQDDAARDAWNALDPFEPGAASAFRDAMQRGLTAVDAHSRHGYWTYPHPLLELMLEDYLLLDPSQTVDVTDTAINHYLELEWQAYRGRELAAAGLAGGRRPVDNSVARFFAIFARQGQSSFANLDALRHALFRPMHAGFPYLGAPYERLTGVKNRLFVATVPLSYSIQGCE